MKGFLSQMFLLAVMTVLLLPHHSSAASDSWESNSQSQKNITYGCVGLPCLVADDFEANLFMDQHGLSRMLLDPGRFMTSGSNIGGQPSIDCEPHGLYSSCLGTKLHTGRPCVPSNRLYPYCP